MKQKHKTTTTAAKKIAKKGLQHCFGALQERPILPQIFIIACSATLPAKKVPGFRWACRCPCGPGSGPAFVYFSAPSNTLINQAGKRAKSARHAMANFRLAALHPG